MIDSVSDGSPVVVSADEARAKGLAPITVRVDAAAAGLFVRPFPMDHALVALNGPPGGPLILMIWDCTGVDTASVADVVRARYNPMDAALELGEKASMYLCGAEVTGVMFRTGLDYARIAWFATRIERPGGTVLVAFGGPGSADAFPTISEMFDSPSPLGIVARTLALE